MSFWTLILSCCRALHSFFSGVPMQGHTVERPIAHPATVSEPVVLDIPGESPRERFIRYAQLLSTDVMAVQMHEALAMLSARIRKLSECYATTARQYFATDSAHPDDHALSEKLTAYARELDEARQRHARIATIPSWQPLEDRSLFAEYATDVFDALTTHPAVTGITVKDHQVMIDLATTYIAEGERRYEIGDFSLLCAPWRSSFSVCCRRTTSCIVGRPHPYWSHHLNSVCFGTADRELYAFLERLDLFGVVDLVVLMLSQPKRGEMHYWKEMPHGP